jgi:hypothetical protein
MQINTYFDASVNPILMYQQYRSHQSLTTIILSSVTLFLQCSKSFMPYFLRVCPNTKLLSFVLLPVPLSVHFLLMSRFVSLLRSGTIWYISDNHMNIVFCTNLYVLHYFQILLSVMDKQQQE